MNNKPSVMIFGYKGIDWKVIDSGDSVMLQYKSAGRTIASPFVTLEGVMAFIDDNFEVIGNGFSSANNGKWLGEGNEY